MGTLNPKTFESGDFSLESGYFSACDIFEFAVEPKWRIYSNVLVTLMAVAGRLILLEFQAIFYSIMGNALFLRIQNYRRKQC